MAAAWFREERAPHLRELFTRMLADVGLRVESPSMLVEQAELAESLRRALRQLTDSEHLIFGLYLQGKSPTEIAELLSMTPNAVFLRRHRVVQKPRRYLQDAGTLPSPTRDED